MRRRKPTKTMDLALEADIVEGASASVVSGEDTTATNETALLDEKGASDADPLVSAIQLQAYELYQSRGGTHGDDVADWLEAERIVRRLRS